MLIVCSHFTFITNCNVLEHFITYNVKLLKKKKIVEVKTTYLCLTMGTIYLNVFFNTYVLTVAKRTQNRFL